MGPTSEDSVLLPYGHQLHKISDTRSLAVYDISHSRFLIRRSSGISHLPLILDTDNFELAQQWVDEESFKYGM